MRNIMFGLKSFIFLLSLIICVLLCSLPVNAQEIILDNLDATYHLLGAPEQGVIILMYHGLDESFGFDPTGFTNQMQYLADNDYQTITLNALQAWIEDGTPEPPNKSVILTFDDNYLTIYSVAYPTLQSHGFIGYNFAHTNYVGVVTGYDHADWTECAEMENAGVIFTESHTRSHRYTSTLNEAEQRSELAGSKADIDTNLSKNCIHLAYPYGNYDATVIQIAEESGYETAVTTKTGLNTRTTPLMELYRYGVNPSTPLATFVSYVSQSAGTTEVDWTHSTSEPGYIGSDYQLASAGSGTQFAEWTLSVPTSGEYEIQAWYTAHSNRATNAPYTINHNSGSTTIRIDQTQNGAQWVSLGSFMLTAEAYYNIQLSNDANGYVIADAIRIVPLAPSNGSFWQLY